MNVIDPILLRDLCYDIEAAPTFEPHSAEIFDVLILHHASIYGSTAERQRRLGLLIGKKGRHLSTLQTKYNVRINVVTDTSSWRLRQELSIRYQSHLFDRRQLHDRCNIHILLTVLDASIAMPNQIEEVKQSLRERWTHITDSSTGARY